MPSEEGASVRQAAVSGGSRLPGRTRLQPAEPQSAAHREGRNRQHERTA